MVFEEKYKKYQYKSGLFPACPKSPNPSMKYSWIRDSYFIWRSGFYQKEIANAFQKILNKHSYKIEHLLNKKYVEHDWEFIHPRYDENLNEVEGEWAWKQLDTLFYLEKVFHESGFYKERDFEAQVHSVDFNGGGSSIWEDGRNYPSGYDIALLSGEWSLIRYEKPNLSHLIALNEKTIYFGATSIIEKVKNELEGEWGVARYKGDKWTGIDYTAEKEYEWCMGFAYLYKLTRDKKYIKKLDEIYKMFGGIPESIDPLTGKPNCNTPLVWAEAIYHEIKNKL